MKRLILIVLLLAAMANLYAQGPNGGRRTMSDSYKSKKNTPIQKRNGKPKNGLHLFKKDEYKVPGNASKGRQIPLAIQDNRKKKKLQPIKHKR